MVDEVADLSDEQFAKLFDKRHRASRTSVQEKRRAEAQAVAADDGRVRRADAAGGLVQLNARVTPDLKNEVIGEARRSGRQMNEVVEDALRLYFQGKRT